MSVIQFVKFSSPLSEDEVLAVMKRRAPEFRQVPGLIQKFYGREVETGDMCGIYIFDSQESLNAFRQTELARTIPSAYQVESPRVEVFEVLFPLHPDVRLAAAASA
ncbi:MAG TPA: YdhR family protein [Gaiellaceae bacterium]|nr:YdhR family protein [Gaiellaceae bacterium]